MQPFGNYLNETQEKRIYHSRECHWKRVRSIQHSYVILSHDVLVPQIFCEMLWLEINTTSRSSYYDSCVTYSVFYGHVRVLQISWPRQLLRIFCSVRYCVFSSQDTYCEFFIRGAYYGFYSRVTYCGFYSRVRYCVFYAQGTYAVFLIHGAYYGFFKQRQVLRILFSRHVLRIFYLRIL